MSASVVYVAVHLIVAPGEPEQVLNVFEFSGDTWMEALDAAYHWLKINRKETCSYHVYC
jgi:hypothetical protein